MDRPGVLVVDQGASFGGSVLVASVIANRMPAERYRVLLAAAIDRDLLRSSPEARDRIVTVTKQYNYVDQARARSHRSSWPTPVRRMAGWGDTAVRIGRNSGYTHRLVRWIRREGIDLVHLNNGFENLEAHLAAGLTRRPVLVHAHGPCGSGWLTRRFAGRAPVCIAISRPVAESFRAVGVPSERIVLLPNPLTVRPGSIDRATRERARLKHGIPGNLVLAGSVGRIVAWKGQLEFLRAAAVALRSVPGTGAVVIGDVTDANDAYGQQLRTEAAQLGIADRVWFTGFISDPAESYGLLDVLVHTSIDPEPFGLVLTEAMAFGIPVVAANTGGPLEIVAEGVDGFLRDPHDSLAVGEVLSRLLRDPELRQRIGTAGRATVLRRFDPDVYAARMADVYDRVLAGQPLETTG